MAKDIVAAIRGLAGVTQHGTCTSYGRRRQNDPLPAVTVIRIGTARDYSLENEIPSAFLTYEIAIYADSEKQLDAIDESIRNYFSGMNHTTVGSAFILSCQVAGETEVVEDPIAGDDRTLLHRSTDYRFHVTQDAPTHGS